MRLFARVQQGRWGSRAVAGNPSECSAVRTHQEQAEKRQYQPSDQATGETAHRHLASYSWRTRASTDCRGVGHPHEGSALCYRRPWSDQQWWTEASHTPISCAWTTRSERQRIGLDTRLHRWILLAPWLSWQNWHLFSVLIKMFTTPSFIEISLWILPCLFLFLFLFFLLILMAMVCCQWNLVLKIQYSFVNFFGYFPPQN